MTGSSVMERHPAGHADHRPAPARDALGTGGSRQEPLEPPPTVREATAGDHRELALSAIEPSMVSSVTSSVSQHARCRSPAASRSSCAPLQLRHSRRPPFELCARDGVLLDAPPDRVPARRHHRGRSKAAPAQPPVQLELVLLDPEQPLPLEMHVLRQHLPPHPTPPWLGLCQVQARLRTLSQLLTLTPSSGTASAACSRRVARGKGHTVAAGVVTAIVTEGQRWTQHILSCEIAVMNHNYTE